MTASQIIAKARTYLGVIVETIVLMYLSFLVATNVYDKVVQTIKQIRGKVGDKLDG